MSLATPRLFRVMAFAAAFGALSLPAAAASVKVNVAGLDAPAVHAQIVRAAETVCSSALADQPLKHYAMSACIDEAVAAASGKFAAAPHHYASLQPNGR